MAITKDEERNKLQQIVATKAYIKNPELLPWYLSEVKAPPATFKLFEEYSKVPSHEVNAHIKKVRDQAFEIFPYPCLGFWGFLNFLIQDGPAYSEVLQRVKGGDQLLDFGCCVGQDLRKLIYDGAPSENTFASDLQGDFWDIGYNLFRDKSTLKTKFIQADILNPESELKELDGKINIVHSASVFHLFEWDDQVKVAKRVIQLLKPVPGSMIFGHQGSQQEAGSFPSIVKGKNLYWHDMKSWQRLWDQVGKETGREWKVEATIGLDKLVEKMDTVVLPTTTKFMRFTIRRV